MVSQSFVGTRINAVVESYQTINNLHYLNAEHYVCSAEKLGALLGIWVASLGICADVPG